MLMFDYGIVSGFFNPIHCGHLDYLEEAKRRSKILLVIVNNDIQAIKKIGRVYINENDRIRIIKSLRVVDDAILSIDTDSSVSKTIEQISSSISWNKSICFFNSGDRDESNQNEEEVKICNSLDVQREFIKMKKRDSSTRLRSGK